MSMFVYSLLMLHSTTPHLVCGGKTVREVSRCHLRTEAQQKARAPEQRVSPTKQAKDGGSREGVTRQTEGMRLNALYSMTFLIC